MTTRGAARSLRTVVVGIAALLLTGCLQADVGVTLDDDESGTFRVKMLLDRATIDERAGMFGEAGATSEDPCADLRSDLDEGLPDGATAAPIDVDGWCGAEVSIPFADLDEFDAVASEFNDDADEGAPNPYGHVSLARVPSGGYRFEATGLQLSEEALRLDGEAGGMTAGALGGLFENLFDDLRIRYDVRLPGNPTEHNADSVDGNTFRWELRFGDGRTELFANTGPGEVPSGGGASNGSKTGLWILIGAVALAIVALTVVLRTRKAAAAKRDGGRGKSFDDIAGTRDDPFDRRAQPPSGQPSPGVRPPAPPDEPPGSSFDDIVRRKHPDWEPPQDS